MSETKDEEKDDRQEPSTEEVKEQVSKEDASDGDHAEEFQFPEISFATFIMSLNASALLNLGVIDDPNTGKKVKNLPIGKQTIDILAMLEEKTKGNLTRDEEDMLKNILYDLRIIYVKEKA